MQTNQFQVNDLRPYAMQNDSQAAAVHTLPM